MGSIGAADQEKAMPELTTKEILRAQTLLFHQVNSFAGDMSLKCAVELGLFDAVADLSGGPVTLQQLSAVLPEVHPSKLSFLPRLMRILTQLGFFTTHTTAGEESFSLTPLSKILVRRNAACMANYVRLNYEPFCYEPALRFSSWFRGPAPTAFEETHGRPLWASMMEDPEMSRRFNEGMAGESSALVQAVVGDCRDVFQGVGSLVDVGGGTGLLATAIAKAFPEIECTVLDLPHVVAAAVPESTGKVSMVAGDMFQHIPPADAILLKQVLHDWNDDDCVRILNKCREAIPAEGGKLLVLEVVVGSDKEDKALLEAQLFYDISMMMMFASSERDVQQWEKLFLRAGFSGFKIKHVLGFRSLMEVYP